MPPAPLEPTPTRLESGRRDLSFLRGRGSLARREPRSIPPGCTELLWVTTAEAGWAAPTEEQLAHSALAGTRTEAGPRQPSTTYPAAQGRKALTRERPPSSQSHDRLFRGGRPCAPCQAPPLPHPPPCATPRPLAPHPSHAPAKIRADHAPPPVPRPQRVTPLASLTVPRVAPPPGLRTWPRSASWAATSEHQTGRARGGSRWEGRASRLARRGADLWRRAKL